MPLHQAQDALKTRRLRPFLVGLAGVGLFFCLAIAIAWYVATQIATRTLDAWILDEQKHGRIWSCPERQMAGFPFAIELRCAEPHFAGLVSGKPMGLHVKALRATVHLFHPHDVTAAIEAPFVLRSEDGRTDMSFAWDSLQVTASGLPDEPGEIAFRGEGLTIHGFAEGLGTLAAQAAHFDGIVGKAANKQERAYDFHFTAHDVGNPLLTIALGSQHIDEFKTDGTITEVAFDAAARPADNLEHWRVRDGRIDFVNLALSRAETQISARGTLKLDAAHQPQGRFATESAGLEPILQRNGINPSLATAGVLLSGLLGGDTSVAAKPGALRLPVRLEGGSVIIGPIHTAIRLPPLY
jgi:hypothetical protein